MPGVWFPMDDVPTDGTPVLVLMAEPKQYRNSRIETASYATNALGQVIGIVGNQFAFDMPTPIGWMLQSDLWPDA